MIELALRLTLGAVLAGAALMKVARPRTSQAALATFGLGPGALRWAALGAICTAELGLAAAVIAGSDLAAFAAAALLVALAAAMALALARGRGGAPCACFGARSRISRLGVARNLALAAAFAAIPLLPEARPSGEAWLVIGLAASWVAIGALAACVLALARELGRVRITFGPQQALEIAAEGPEVGARAPALLERVMPEPGGETALAVFSSPACGMCRRLEPQVEALGREPGLAVATIDEEAESQVWQAHDVPGSPYAVALDRDATVLAKGTFNNLAQLESLLATAERRRRDPLAGMVAGG